VVRDIKPTLNYKNEGGQSYDSIITSCYMPIISGAFTKDLVKTWVLIRKTCLHGIPCPTCRHHFLFEVEKLEKRTSKLEQTKETMMVVVVHGCGSR